MGVEVTCNDCSKDVSDDVQCSACAKKTCSECGDVGAKLYCSDCAEDDFGEGDGSAATNVRDDDLIDLAAAIRAGNMRAAMDSLERVAREIEGWSDLIAPGRYSNLAIAA